MHPHILQINDVLYFRSIRCMLFRGTERNQRRIFRKMLKRGTIVSIELQQTQWRIYGGARML